MANTSADTKAHSGHDDSFLSALKHLKEAEGKAAKIVEEAKKQAASSENQAREKAVGALTLSKDKSVEAKNSVLAAGRAAADSEIARMISDSNKQAEKIRAKRLQGKDIEGLCGSIL